MGTVIYKIQNVSGWSPEEPDIMVDENDPNWETYLELWRGGKNPTDSKFWKKGIFALTKLKET